MTNLNRPILDDKDAEIFVLRYKLNRLEQEYASLVFTLNLLCEDKYKLYDDY